MQVARTAHAARCAALVERLHDARGGAPLALAKRSSNLFRDRASHARRRLDLGAFDQVLEVNPAAGWVDAEGLASFEQLVAATLPLGTMPAVVPQLKTITLGGAAAGVGIEATSFRHGLVHDTLLEIDLALPDGRVLTCTRENEHRELFHAFPNSYGTLGYALRLRQRLLPVQPFVQVEHRRFDSAEAFFAALAHHGAQGVPDAAVDFLDGVVFGPRCMVLNLARFAGQAAEVSDYTGPHIYYRSLLERPFDTLTAAGYLWRWDTDWFWCSKNLGAQNRWLRPLFGRRWLNSRTYTRLMRLNGRLGLTERLERWRGQHAESVIQDVDIPVAQAAEFLAFLLREVGILPVWICPLRTPARVPLYPLEPGALYVNFGFWDRVRGAEAHEAGHLNRRIERETARLGGLKSLYSESYFTRAEFDRAYGGADYRELKARWDPGHRLPGLYEKCVLRA